MDKKDFVGELWEMVNATPIEKIAEMRTDVLKFGRNYKCLCPFHNDDKVGSFILGGKINTFKCFSCGASGDGVNLISHFDNISNTRAMLEIALDFGYITEEQKLELQKGKEKNKFEFSKDYQKGFVPFEENEELLKIAPVEVLNNVFSLFSEGNKLLNEQETRLSKKHMDYLLKERGLTKKEIEDNGFFTFPEVMIIGKFYERLYNDFGYTPMILQDVPGFYGAKYFIDTSNYPFSDKDENINAFLFSKADGIGIPMKDANGNIIGIQIRLDSKKQNGLRYIWFSSSWAMTDENVEYCTSAGAPKDVVYPEKLKNTTVFITEGKFKSIEIAKNFGSASISMQGVTTWRGVEDLIKEVSIVIGKPVKNVVLAYDADMGYNIGVSKQTFEMAKSIHESTETNVYISIWDTKFGKGIDDMIQNGYKQMIDKTDFKTFEKWMVPFILEVEKRWKKDKIPKKEMHTLFRKMVLNNFDKYKKTEKVTA